MSESLKNVDHSAMRVNQITIIILNLVAFIANLWCLSAIVTVFMIAGTAIGKPGFVFLYRYILKPAGIVKPKIHQDNPEPHRFAQGFGAVVLAVASVLLYFGAATLGWILVWLVIALAALNAFAGFCAGCFVYYQLSKIKFPGFKKLPPEGTFPGMKPKARVA